MNEGHSPAFYGLAAFFGLFVLFLYGPTIVIFILSFQGPTGGLTFPLNGVSLHRFEHFGGRRRGRHRRRLPALAGTRPRRHDSYRRVVVDAPGLAFRRRFFGANAPVLSRGGEPDRALDHHLARHRARISRGRRHFKNVRAGVARRQLQNDDGHVHLRPWRASHLDAAVRPVGHVCDLQPLRRRATRRPRAISARRRGRRCAMS